MKTTVGEASKVARAAEKLIELLGKDAPNGAYFSQLSVKNGIEKIQNSHANFADIGDALTQICNFCKKLDGVEINVK